MLDRNPEYKPPAGNCTNTLFKQSWAHVQLKGVKEGIFMNGRWRQLPEWRNLKSGNTTKCYNISRQAACDALMPTHSSLLNYAKRMGIELTAEHIAGVDNVNSDRLSWIAPGEDYTLKEEGMLRV